MKRTLALLALTSLFACEESGFYTTPITGPRTKDADAFAKSFLNQMQARSFEANREFCGIFGRDADGYVIATAPIQGQFLSCNPPDPAPGFNKFASYHSHGAFDRSADPEVPTTSDVLADQDENVVGYVSTPGGRVWRNWNGVTHQLCGRGCIAVDPAFEPRVYGPVARRYTIAQLRQREMN